MGEGQRIQSYDKGQKKRRGGRGVNFEVVLAKTSREKREDYLIGVMSKPERCRGESTGKKP